MTGPSATPLTGNARAPHERLRILTVCHNHPQLHPGGTEILAHELFIALKQGGRVEGLFLACTNQIHRDLRPGTLFQTIGRSADELLLWTGHFDRFNISQIDLQGVVPELTTLLRSFRPDIVHLHHTLLFGVEMLFLIRRVLPSCRIILTLHDYYAICANDGQMVKTGSHELCYAAGLDACNACFPDRSRDRFLMREKHMKTMLGFVDRFVAPSRFLRDRYIAWGVPADRISVIGNGRPAVEPAPAAERPRRDRFGYFGNINPFKGAAVLLEAAGLLAQAGGGDARVIINGGMPFQTPEFRARIEEGLHRHRDMVTHNGPYRTADLPHLMREVDWVVVPSIWWENAPLVILEAFRHRRPMLCSGIGGMAELAPDGRGAIHVPPGDPQALARAMGRAAADPDLWRRMVAAIPDVPTLDDVAAEYLALYQTLRAEPGRGRGSAVPAAWPAPASTDGRLS